VGYVPQSIFLLDDTIRRNVAFGYPDSEIDDAKVWDVLKEAQLDEYIKTLPDGLDTQVGERGVKFSGGQRQRIAIARTLYRDPDIIVLDEATSALDGDTEKAVMESVDALQGHKTLIIVAHRLSTIKNCTHIYKVGGGVATRREWDDINPDKESEKD
jgi:ABC-type multidrug transport system fused ATPase/permease subunit